MTYAKRWIMAGAAAALLGGAGHASAGTMGRESGGDPSAPDSRTIHLTGGAGVEMGFVAAGPREPVQFVLPLGQPVTVSVRPEPNGIGYTAERPASARSQADRAAVDDAAELAAGNSGGRG
jgi:hypothetical protein